MKNAVWISLFSILIIIGCGKNKNTKTTSENVSQQKDFIWITLQNNDSIKFKGFSTRYFNKGQDSVIFAHYETHLYNNQEDSKNPMFKKKSILVLSALSEKASLPDTMYIQAKGTKSGAFIKNSIDFNIFAGFDGKEWKISDENKWKSLADY